jgi:predicted metal-binding membrane protein
MPTSANSTSPGRASGTPPDLARYARRVPTVALVTLAVLAWVELLVVPMPMPGESGVVAAAYAVLTLAMWLVMMLAMMVPSVAPVVLLYDRAIARQLPDGATLTLCFIAGYATAWAVFSVAATALQIALIEGGFVDTMGAVRSRRGAGVLLLATALYQWLPAKSACLEHCRSPLDFIVRQRRPGRSGAWRMGLRHGLWCVGCCWMLMLLLFVGGVMNLAWVAGLTLVIALEKLGPRPAVLRRIVGIAALGAGVACLLHLL